MKIKTVKNFSNLTGRITCYEVYVACREWPKLSACGDERGEPSKDMLCFVLFFKYKI